MQLLPLEKLGPRPVEGQDGVIRFGLFLPWVAAVHGNRLYLKIIHEQDQFLQQIQPLEFELAHSIDPVYGDYWSVEVDIAGHAPLLSQSAWGSPGRYVYRYCLLNPNASTPIDWIIDPFAREFGAGKLSAFTLGYQDYIWDPRELTWKTPALDDLVIYELMITEFGGDIERTIGLLYYLADLGVNCLELMPVSNISNMVDWGFLPLGYFGVDERFGKRRDMQHLIDAAHQRGLAVIIDSVYGHTGENFPYQYLYDRLGKENPFMGPFACKFGWLLRDNDLFKEGDRERWYKVQPHLIALMTAKGIPLLWQGQEFGENYYIPPNGYGRVMLFRPVRWDYFYDPIGKLVIWLVRRLLQIRRQPQFRRGKHYFYNDYWRYQAKGVLLSSRSTEQCFSLVALNFTDQNQSVPFTFPLAGDYKEELHGQYNLTGLAAEEERLLVIPSNYGCIWTRQIDA